MGGLAAGAAALVLDVADEGGGAPMIVANQADNLTYDVGPFEEISTTGPQDVVVTQGDTISVRSEGSPDALGLLEAVVEDGKLVIRPKGRFGPFSDWGRLRSATFYVTVPRLESVSVAGSGDVRADRIVGDEFVGTIAGSGELNIAALEVDEADFSIGGSGDIVAAGTAREARVQIGGSGEVRARELRAQTASVRIGGSGDVELTAQDEAEVSIAGGGEVVITGPARCSVSRIGGGDVRCEGGGGTDDF